MAESRCSFCGLNDERIVHSNALAVAIRDAYPVSQGHTLIVTKRHVTSFFDATESEIKSVLDLLVEVKVALTQELAPDGYTIGCNDGEAAGQTVPHLHIHLIPRFAGDVPDARGGVRWVLPDKAAYWSDNGD